MTIAAACPLAKDQGIEAGMAVTQARLLVPGLILHDADPEGDAGLLTRLALVAARRWTPTAAVYGPDSLYLDLTGVSHLFGGEREFCGQVLRFCTRLGLAARIAVADTYGAAHALAHHRQEGAPIQLCLPGAQAEALAPLPLAALRIDETAESAARRLGIERIGDLLAMPRAPLERRFGDKLLLRLDHALGHTAEAIDPIVPQEAPAALIRFAEPIATSEAVAAAIRHLLTLLTARLERQGVAGRRFILSCLRIDGVEQRIAVGTARATRDGNHLESLLTERIERIEPGFGIEAMRLVAGRCEPLGPRTIPLGTAILDESDRTLVPLIDRLVNRLGVGRLFRPSAVESDVPERSVRRVPPLDPVSSWPADWPRPIRLLARPERIEKVAALLPDGPPRRFTWRGVAHVVRQADGPERIYGEWWKKASEAEAVRDYFQVEDEEGARFWLFRRGDGVDARTGDLSWYVHGIFG